MICPSDVDETTPADWSPAHIVEQLALRKAAAVATTRPIGDIVVGSDTIVVLDEQVLGKPRDRAHAIEMVTALQGREHEVFSGIACIQLEGDKQLFGHRRTKVRMKTLSPAQVEQYVDTGEPMDKAGAYAIQGIGAMFIEGIEGCYFNVVGLPVAALADMLKELGVDII
jgi:septum formation protein